MVPGSEDRELFVRNLPLQDMDPQQLREYFEGFGEVEDLHLMQDPFTLEPATEGYVRFRHHRDALRCIEALTPTDSNDADPMDLTGTWSESERAMQRKANCYRFNLVAELVGADGSGLERLKIEAGLKGLWVLAESLQQKDRSAPPAWGRQLQFVGRFVDEAHVQLFRELLERALEETHIKISDRIEKRRKKEAAVAAAAEEAEKVGAGAPPLAGGVTIGGPAETMAGLPPNGQGWPAGAGWPAAGGYWGGWRPPVGTPVGGPGGPGAFDG